MFHSRQAWIPTIRWITPSCEPGLRCFLRMACTRCKFPHGRPLEGPGDRPHLRSPSGVLDVLLSVPFIESPGVSVGARVCYRPKSKNNEAIRGLALFRTRLTLGYVRDWCAESGRACSASRGRGQ